ncbi:MAG TPA: hypothetical protein VGO52_13765 [Hyphomonadaceae bacterium]|nr:hypothetical protein [Hyphomonadaceae bacterium]
MDFAKIGSDFLDSLPHDWPGFVAFLGQLLENTWARALGLMLLVYITIRIIAAVYGGEKNGAELGPVAIRPHVSGRHDDQTVRVPHSLVPMSMDGVSADCKIIYAYTDTKGKRRRRVVKTIKNSRLSISPVNIPRIQDIIFGQEVPSVPREFVCFPLEIEEPSDTVPKSPDDALEYARLHKILERWREDDDAITVSMHSDVKTEVAEGKTDFIKERVAAQQKAKAKWLSRTTTFARLRKSRPNVVGSYYLKFEFSHNPFFVLTRHPDRDLKMTAWLTVLTSMFALVMDAWPIQAPRERGLVMPDFQNVETSKPTPRVPAIPPS